MDKDKDEIAGTPVAATPATPAGAMSGEIEADQVQLDDARLNEVRPGLAARRYAKAVLELAMSDSSPKDGEAKIELLRDELRVWLLHVAQADGYRSLELNPAISQAARAALLGRLLDAVKASKLFRSLILVLCENRRMVELPGILSELNRMLADIRGELVGKVFAASELTSDDLSSIKSALEKKTGKSVTIDFKIDQSLVGGLVVKYGTSVIDASVRARLNNIKLAMREL